METFTRPQYPEQIFKDKVIQNEDTRDNKNFPQAGEWVTSIDYKDVYFIYQSRVSPESTCVSTSRVSPTNSKLCYSVCPQLLWSSTLVRPERGQGQTHPRALADPTDKNKRSHDRPGMPGPETDVLEQFNDEHGQWMHSACPGRI